MKEDSGASMVEFALSITILLTTVFAILQFSMVIYANHFLSYAAEEAARYAMVRGSTWKNATCTTTTTESCTAVASDVTRYVQSITPASVGASNTLNVVTAWTGLTPSGATCSTAGVNNSPGCVVQVQLSISVNSFVPFIPNNTWVMNNTSSLVITQ
jgi:Flp pilus assembly protein TadG